ncbi:HlyD family secretion protein [Flavobacterium ginsenosidimutans]|uniref:HlyD family secretion protein n=1 Tax=Flavobacterium ginsenosidimutans TaxID=687844 RepID=UPI003D970D57
MTAETNKTKYYISRLTTFLAVAIVIAAGFYLIKYLMRSADYQETNDAQVESFINPVSARAGGYIARVYFNEHQLVKAGDTLVTIDSREYQERLIEAEAAVQDNMAQLGVLESEIHSAAIAVLVSKNQISGAKSRLWKEQQDISRYEKLLKEEAVTGSDFEQVKVRYDIAQSDYDSSINKLDASNSRIKELQARRALLQADLKKKQALLSLARLNLSYTVIKAPYDGKTGRKTILEGQQIQAGQTLLQIINEDQKWITANFKETQVTGMYIGQPVEIRIDAIDNKVFRGEITAISGSTGSKFSILPTDNSTGNFVKIVQRIPVKIAFTQKDLSLFKAGMNTSVSIKNSRP